VPETGASSSATASLSPVQKEILRCVAAGEVADFLKDKATRRKRRVDASFLRDLWLELDPAGKIHPCGIKLRGLRIAGALDLRGIVHSASGRERLCALSATDCDFENAVTLAGVSIERLELTRCRIRGRGPPSAKASTGLNCEGADIAGECILQDIAEFATIEFTRARIGGRLVLAGGRNLSDLRLNGAHVGGPVSIENCRFTLDTDGFCLDLAYAVIAGRLDIRRCYSRGKFAMNYVRVRGVDIAESRFGDVWSVGGQISFLGLDRVAVTGFMLFLCTIEGAIAISRVFACPENPAEPGIRILASEVRGNIAIRRSRIRYGIDLGHTSALHVSMASIKIVGSPTTFVNLKMVRTSDVSLVGLNLEGWIDLANSRLAGSFQLSDSRLGVPLSASAESAKAVVAKEEEPAGDPEIPTPAAGARGADAVILTNAKVAGDVQIANCAIDGTVYARNLEVGVGLSITDTWIEGRKGRWSIEFYLAKCAFIVFFARCRFGSGAAFPLLCCSELQVCGCSIDSPDNPRGRNIAIWATEMTVGRLIDFGAAAPARSGEPGLINRICGRLEFGNSSIGRNFRLASTDCRLPKGPSRARLGVAVSLARASIGADCLIADRRHDQLEAEDHYDVPADVRGCVRLDDANIGGDLEIHRTILTADGSVTRPDTSFASEERVSKRKRGVALSLRDARVAGRFEIGEPRLKGLVDLRGATIGLLADGGGKRWCGAGLAPGHLLLDGLTYRRLDDIEDDAANAGKKTIIGNVSVAAERRLDWLMLQFPNRLASADSFVPQPYEQLARVFAGDGNERARRRVIVAKRDMQRRHGRLGRFERGIGWLLRQTSDYGYSPFRAVLALSLFIAIGTLAAVCIDAHGALVLSSTDSVGANHLNPLVYAIDVALPIVDLQQDDMFVIDAAKLPGLWNNAGLVSLLRALYELVGFVLVSITVLTFTGVLRDRD
jgi:hypothetical protein